MRIVVGAYPLLSPLTGVGRYTLHISEALRSIPENRLYYFYGVLSDKPPEKNELSGSSNFSKAKELFKKSPLNWFLRKIKHFSGFLLPEFDIYLEPNFIPLKGVRAKKIVEVIHDFSFHFFPEFHPEERIRYFKTYFWKEIKRANILVFDSNAIYKEAIELRFPEEKLRVIYPGIDHRIFHPYKRNELNSFKEKYNLPENFLLFVGSIEPRKNLRTLLLAYELLPESFRKEFPLIVAGFSGWKNKDIIESFKRLKVRYLGYISDSELSSLYNLATLLICPSIYEGFGFPPLEAMACGCPVVVSDIPVFHETCKDAAFYVDPYSPESIAESIEKILSSGDLLKEKSNRGIKRVRSFDWKKTAFEFLNLFDLLLSQT